MFRDEERSTEGAIYKKAKGGPGRLPLNRSIHSNVVLSASRASKWILSPEEEDTILSRLPTDDGESEEQQEHTQFTGNDSETQVT